MPTDNPTSPGPAQSAETPPEQGLACEMSIVMPCLNEAETLESCIRDAQRYLSESGISGEVIIADNGSSDGSQRIAERMGARVVSVSAKGYGSALMAGFAAARGKYLLMGDADASYDFVHLDEFTSRLRSGYDVVMGNRFKGGIAPGAMPWHHKYIGNPVLTGILNLFFRTGIRDAHCGLRGLTRDALRRMNLRTTGMEFASEIVVKAAVLGLRMTEVPTTLKPDGRSRAPHLRSFRDGWRHLRFLMLLAPNWLLMLPGALMGLTGLLLMALTLSGPVRIGQTVLDIHTMLVAGSLILIGYHALTIGFAARIFALEEQIGFPSGPLQWGFRVLSLERGIIAGGILVIAGVFPIAWVLKIWADRSFGALDLARTLRPTVVGVMLLALGAQTILMSFFYSMLGLQRRTRS